MKLMIPRKVNFTPNKEVKMTEVTARDLALVDKLLAEPIEEEDELAFPADFDEPENELEVLEEDIKQLDESHKRLDKALPELEAELVEVPLIATFRYLSKETCEVFASLISYESEGNTKFELTSDNMAKLRNLINDYYNYERFIQAKPEYDKFPISYKYLFSSV